MSRWLRFYDDAINDPKILKLPEALRWSWVAVLCIASKNNGSLPGIDDIALMLRVTPQKAASVLAALSSAGLLDRTEGGFAPHNWDGRQYKSDKPDETAAERMRKHRERKRVSSVTVTPVTDRNTVTVTVPRADTEQITDTEKKDAAVAARDPRTVLFSDGVEALKGLTGKHDAACRAFIGKCLKQAEDDATVVFGAIQEAQRLRVADAGGWIMASLRPSAPASGKPLTEFQRKQVETNDVRSDLRNLADGGFGGRAPYRFLSNDSGERPEGLRSGSRPALSALPGTSGG